MKKLSTILLIVVSVSALLFVAGCGDNGDMESTAADTPEEAAETMDENGEMTEEIFIDIVAYTMYWDAEELPEEDSDKKLEMLYNEHGVTEEQFNDYEAMLLEKPEEYNQIMEKVDERVEELSNKEAPKEEVKDKKETK